MDTTILRQDPLFKVQFKEEGFEIYNEANTGDNGWYAFRKTDSIHLERRRVNWFVSILSFVVDLFTGGGTGGIFREKDHLKLRYDASVKRIPIYRCNMKVAEKLVQRIENSITKQKKCR